MAIEILNSLSDVFSEKKNLCHKEEKIRIDNETNEICITYRP